MSDTPPLALDGVDVLGPAPGGPALLRADPFALPEGPDPFLERLEALLCAGPPARPAAPASAGAADAAALRPRRRGEIPRLAELDTPPPHGLLERLYDDDQRRRLAALDHVLEDGCAYDRFGLSPATLRRAFPFFLALYRVWFRVQSRGAENLPALGGAVLAANHGGLLPFDGAMLALDVLLHTDPPRLARAVVDRWAGTLPWVNVFFARVGQVIGTRENVAGLLDDEQLVLVFPEGMDGIRKSWRERQVVQKFHVGFVEEALRSRVPIVPVALVGSDDQAPILYDVKPLARWLGLPVAPITPTFPWLGPLGLLPYPVSYSIRYGAPLRFHERFGPDAADDQRLVRFLANQVRAAVQQLLARGR